MSISKEIKILLVDDSISLRMVAKKVLINLGYENVTLADDGTTALEKLKEHSFDLVISDWNMKEMSGIELVQEMNSDQSLKHIPFLLVTGEEDQDALLEAIKAGISNFMTKPYNAEILSKKIERVFAFKEELQKRNNSLSHSSN